ncbi:hypothetical protein DFH09DRAFT_1116178 [Mycena vulgaris]|nr:hypothetical protein DFH09DRAFT_1116178 [Mycena vulgaris]
MPPKPKYLRDAAAHARAARHTPKEASPVQPEETGACPNEAGVSDDDAEITLASARQMDELEDCEWMLTAPAWGRRMLNYMSEDLVPSSINPIDVLRSVSRRLLTSRRADFGRQSQLAGPKFYNSLNFAANKNPSRQKSRPVELSVFPRRIKNPIFSDRLVTVVTNWWWLSSMLGNISKTWG